MIDYLAQIAVFVTVFGTVGYGLNLVTGFGGMFSVAHAVYFGIGAYGYALLVTAAQWPKVPAIVAAVALAALIGSVVAFPALRLRGDYLVVASLAIELVGFGVMQNWNGVTGGAAGVFAIPFFSLDGLGLPSNAAFALVGTVMLVVVVLLVRRLVRSPWGRVLRAIRDDEIVALSLGKHVTRTKVTAFGISAAVSAVAGVLYAGFVGFIDPESFNLQVSITILSLVLVGGAGTVLGPLVGAVIIIGVPELIRVIDLPSSVGAQLDLLFGGAVLVLCMLLRPQGITGAGPAGTGLARAGAGVPVPGDEQNAAAPGRPDSGLALPRSTESDGGVLTATDLELRIGQRAILDGLSITARPGEVVALIGPNGAGKTTFLDVVTGFSSPGRGTVDLDGRNVTGMKPDELARAGVIRVFQDQRVLATLSVLDNVLIGCRAGFQENAVAAFDPRTVSSRHRRRFTEQAMDLLTVVGLADKAQEAAGGLSGGQQRLVAIVRALCAEPRVLLLDEPCAGVAGPLTGTLGQLVRRLAEEHGCTVLVIEHNTEFVEEVADEVVFLDRGRVLRRGTPAEVFGDHELSRVYFGVEPPEATAGDTVGATAHLERS